MLQLAGSPKPPISTLSQNEVFALNSRHYPGRSSEGGPLGERRRSVVEEK
jgi:hypothetical protein